MLKKLGLITICAGSVFAMNNAELNLNDKDLEVGVKFDMGQYNENVEPESVFFGGKIIKGSNDNSDYSSGSDIEEFLEANLLVQTKVEETDSTFGMGIKFNYTKNYASIPLGLELKYRIDAVEEYPVYVKGSLYYAPTVLSFRDSENFFEYRIQAELEVMKNAIVSLGYRSIDTNYDSKSGGDVNYNKSLYLGVNFSF
ncbi:YfaZ family outer membrane protein [Sulfurimonas sp.]|uniref:YfaZ family outer membrane protein n=1 Tax=Sulfurimonas sp. TaxID=2022749 RepID=UPI0025D8C93A|nr:YfaZ family outer membrane protein [Sulfurimonas sp.]